MFRAPTLSVVLPRMALDAWWNAWLATWQDIGDEVLGYEEDPNFESEMPICHDPANAEWS